MQCFLDRLTLNSIVPLGEHAVVEDHGQIGVSLQHGLQLVGERQADEHIDDDPEVFSRAPEGIDSGIVEVFFYRVVEVSLGLSCRDAAHAAHVEVLDERFEQGGALGILRVECADAHHPWGIGLGRVSQEAVVEAVGHAGVYGDNSLDAGRGYLLAKVRYDAYAGRAVASAFQNWVALLVIIEYVSVCVGYLHGLTSLGESQRLVSSLNLMDFHAPRFIVL